VLTRSVKKTIGSSSSDMSLCYQMLMSIVISTNPTLSIPRTLKLINLEQVGRHYYSQEAEEEFRSWGFVKSRLNPIMS
jgi:hypothetical protein